MIQSVVLNVNLTTLNNKLGNLSNFTNTLPPISTSNTNPLKNADGSVFKGTGGTYLVVLQTATSYSDCASVYIINNKSITQLYSGRDRSPVVSYSEEVGGYVAGLKQYDTAMTVYYGIVRII